MRVVSVIAAAALVFSTSLAPGFAQETTTPTDPAVTQEDDDDDGAVGGLADSATEESDIVVEGLLILGTGAAVAGIIFAAFGNDNNSTPSTNVSSTPSTN